MARPTQAGPLWVWRRKRHGQKLAVAAVIESLGSLPGGTETEASKPIHLGDPRSFRLQGSKGRPNKKLLTG